MKTGLQTRAPLSFRRDETSQIFKRVASRFDIKENNLVLTYYVNLPCGRKVKYEIVKLQDINEMKRSLEMFYVQTEDMAEVAVSEVRGLKRKKRPVEELFDRFKKHHVIDRKLYKDFISQDIARKYLQSLSLIRVVLGSVKCMNFLNPGYYFCHVPGCPRPEVLLRSFNNLKSIDDHWKYHEDLNKCHDASAVVLRLRYDYLHKRRIGSDEAKMQELITDLESRKTVRNKSLAISALMVNKRLVYKDSQFSSRDRLIDEEVLKKILLGDNRAIELVREPGRIVLTGSSTQ